jgi:hypothetical protein
LRRRWGNDRDFGALADIGNDNTTCNIAANVNCGDIDNIVQQYLVYVNDSVSGRDFGFAQ